MQLCRIFSVCCLHMTHEHISNAVHGCSSSVTSQMETSSSITVFFTDEHVYFCQCLLFFFFFYVLRTSLLDFFSQYSLLPRSVWTASSFLCLCSPLDYTARNVCCLCRCTTSPVWSLRSTTEMKTKLMKPSGLKDWLFWCCSVFSHPNFPPVCC